MIEENEAIKEMEWLVKEISIDGDYRVSEIVLGFIKKKINYY